MLTPLLTAGPGRGMIVNLSVDGDHDLVEHLLVVPPALTPAQSEVAIEPPNP